MKELQAVILAGGRGKRLHPITLNHSKAMTPILGVPIIQRVIKSLEKNGIKRFVLVRAPDDYELENLAKKLKEENHLEIKLAVQPEAKGSAHALACARELIDSDFILASCDNLYPDEHFQKIIRCFFETKACAVFTLSKIKPGDLNRSAGVKLKENEIIEIKEKPGENSGKWDAISKFLFVLSKRILDFLDLVEESERGEREIQSAIRLLIEDQKPHQKPMGIFVSNYLHLTSAKDLIEIHKHYLSNHKPYSIHPQAKLEDKIEIVEPVMIEKDVVIKSGARIGPFVYIGQGACLEEKVSLEEVVVYPNVKITSGTQKSYQVLID